MPTTGPAKVRASRGQACSRNRAEKRAVARPRTGAHPEGYSAELITGKIGKRAVWQPDVTLRGVRVPLENRLDGAHSFRDASRVGSTDKQSLRLAGGHVGLLVGRTAATTTIPTIVEFLRGRSEVRE